jgi:SH3-like domain-containing protein
MGQGRNPPLLQCNGMIGRGMPTASQSWLVAALALLLPLALVMAPANGLAQQSAAGLDGGGAPPLPRFASLKSDQVGMRAEPKAEQPVLWVYRSAGLPIEVVSEVEGWRQIRDGDGITGWVAAHLVSARRTAIVLAGGRERRPASLHVSASARAASRATLEIGVVVDVAGCDGRWCEVSAGEHKGFVEQGRLWGVRAGEVIR